MSEPDQRCWYAAFCRTGPTGRVSRFAGVLYGQHPVVFAARYQAQLRGDHDVRVEFMTAMTAADFNAALDAGEALLPAKPAEPNRPNVDAIA